MLLLVHLLTPVLYTTYFYPTPRLSSTFIFPQTTPIARSSPAKSATAPLHQPVLLIHPPWTPIEFLVITTDPLALGPRATLVDSRVPMPRTA